METICEFCAALRPVVYCKADAAHLCLSCDVRVHSANALSGRHFRTLLCQLCRNRPAYVWCVNHEMFICRNCDRALHGFSSQHQKRQLKTYTGCPSPKDFAVLWGFDIKLLDNLSNGDRFVSYPTSSADKGVVDLKSQKPSSPKSSEPSACSSTSFGYLKMSSRSSSQLRRMNQRGDPQQDNYDILQQIIGLKRPQPTEQKQTPLLRGKEQAEFSAAASETSQRLDENLILYSQKFPDISNDLQAMDISHQSLKEELCPYAFSQLEHLTSPGTVGTLTTGDTSWQCKSPVYDTQLWSQNMQDIGFCEEYECFDDIPDIDPTFNNFEELFGGDHDLTRQFIESEDVFSAFENMSQDISGDDYAKSSEGASAFSSDNLAQQLHQNTQATTEIPVFISKQLSLSRLSTEEETSSIPGTLDSDGTQIGSSIYKDKRKTRRQEKGKQSRYSPTADLRKNAKYHIMKPDRHQTGSRARPRKEMTAINSDTKITQDTE